MENKKAMTTYQMTTTACFTAVMCVLGPMSIPIGQVPITFTNLVIYLAVFLLGTKFGTLSYGIYLKESNGEAGTVNHVDLAV